MGAAFVSLKNGAKPKSLGLDEESLYVSIAFDPGGTTGWSVFGVHIDAIYAPEFRLKDNIEFWSAGQFFGPERSQCAEMWALVEAWPRAKIVMEDFVLRKFTSARELLSPVRITARFDERLACEGDDRCIILQQSSLAMTAFTDDRLRRLGLYNHLSGQEHARDSVRHNLTWLRRAKKLAEQNMITNAIRGDEDDN
jgi:hypothetical protein